MNDKYFKDKTFHIIEEVLEELKNEVRDFDKIQESIIMQLKEIARDQIDEEVLKTENDYFDWISYMNLMKKHYEDQKKPFSLDAEFTKTMNEVQSEISKPKPSK